MNAAPANALGAMIVVGLAISRDHQWVCQPSDPQIVAPALNVDKTATTGLIQDALLGCRIK